MAYDGGNTTGFPSPASIYLETVLDLSDILDLKRPSRYPVRVVGGSLPARGIMERDILVVDSSLERSVGRVCVVMTAGEVFLAVLKKTGPNWHLERGGDQEVPVTDDTEVWGIVISIVRQAI